MSVQIDTETDAAAWVATQAVLQEVAAERVRQDRRWGVQDHPDGTGSGVAFLHGRSGLASTMGVFATVARCATDRAAREGRVTWADILTEEYAEALAESDPTKIRGELIQAIAVGVAWIEKIDRSQQ